MNNENKKLYRCVQQIIPTLVKIKSIERAENCTSPDWEWRLKYTGMLGTLVITTFTEGKYDGESRISFVGDKQLTTSNGRLLTEDDLITLTTKNTIYTFEMTDLLPAFLAEAGDITVN